MSAAGIIALAGAQGVTLTTDAKRIIARPANKLTAELRDAIRTHKAILLELLNHDHRPASIDPDSVSPRHASDCGQPLSDLPRDARQDDRRAAPSDPYPQTGAATSTETRLIADPTDACSTCGGWQWWQPREGGAWHCRACEADAMPLTATTLTIGPPWAPSA